MTVHKKLQNQLKINKNNVLTDGYIPHARKAVLPDKLINVLYWKHQDCGDTFTVSLVELRKLLGLKSIKDDERIYNAITLLQAPLQVKNFSYKGKNVEWISAPFLSRAVRWTDSKKMLEIQIDSMMVEALQQKCGYTPLDINICNQFKTKYGLKLYEMIIRYYHLPNKMGKGMGTVSRSIEQLNAMFGSTFKTNSEIKRGIDRGLREIEKITNEPITCFFNRQEDKFIFGWHQKSKYPKLRIPFKRIDELIDWYISKSTDLIINSIPKYRQTLKRKIISDEFNDLDAYYRGLMQHKYNLAPDQYIVDGKYLDFKAKAIA